MTVQESSAPAIAGAARSFVRQDHLLFINGKRMPALSGQVMDVFDPSDDSRLGGAAEGGAADVDAAVLAARAAFEGPWSRLTPSARGQLIWRLADAIMQNAEELATINTLENGKPIGDSLHGEVPFTADVFRYYAGLGHQAER